MQKSIFRYKLGKTCPHCGNWDLERVPRPFFSKYVLFFLDLKSYWCRKCYVIINTLKKESDD
ncbi:MAG: hypothetical protein LCH37_00725 [Bacteroidetes bacterium]|nr:hypothetical protein [Bacteroidota bacterium]